jgi:site-specific recombinase XerD
MSRVEPFENAPDYVRKFLINEIIQRKSPATVEEYYYDIRLFLKYIAMEKRKAEKKEQEQELPELSFLESQPDKEDRGKMISLKKNRKKTNKEKDLEIRKQEKQKLDQVEEESITDEEILGVTTYDVESFVAYLMNNMLDTEATRSRKISALRSFYAYLLSKKWIDENPVASIPLPRKKRSLPVYLTLEESEALLDFFSKDQSGFKERNFCIVTLFLNIGMRLEELVGINRSDIKDGEKITITGKGNKERTIYLNEACKKAIKNYEPNRIAPPEGSQDEDALFTSRQKNRISRRMVQKIIKDAIYSMTLKDGFSKLDGKKYSTHKLRHTAATLMYQYGGTDIRALQDVLGHENLSSTQIYTHVSDEQVKSAIANNPLNKFRED